MLKGLLICALAGGAAAPLLAKDEPAPLGVKAGAIAARERGVAYGARVPAVALKSTTTSTRLRPFTLPAQASHAVPSSLRGLGIERRQVTADSVRAAAEWTTPTDASGTTSDAGARYAVRDGLTTRYKPREPRSAFSTMFNLRLDGRTDSPSFSVGGSAVSSAVWRLLPTR